MCLHCNCHSLALDSVAKHCILRICRPGLNKNTEHIFHSFLLFRLSPAFLRKDFQRVIQYLQSLTIFYNVPSFAVWFNVWKSNSILGHNRSIVFYVMFHWRRELKRGKLLGWLFCFMSVSVFKAWEWAPPVGHSLKWGIIVSQITQSIS